jgi:hypothetical protein
MTPQLLAVGLFAGAMAGVLMWLVFAWYGGRGQ